MSITTKLSLGEILKLRVKQARDLTAGSRRRVHCLQIERFVTVKSV
jgi:hypothetical protein